MTADAKVGLLLGLVFIVIIAFLVNGLPNFLRGAEAEDVPFNAIPSPTGPDLVIDDRVMETARQLQPPVTLRESDPHQDVIPLNPQGDQRVQGELAVGPIEPVAPVQSDRETTRVDIPAAEQDVVGNPAGPVVLPEPVTETKARIHVVQSGETLAAVAQKYYGKEEGNRRLVIQKLYEANSKVLTSQDKVRVGDKLSIPPLSELTGTAVKTDQSQGLLNKFSTMLERVGGEDKKQISEYVVQKGDSLWSIAEQTLGEGKRYQEILKSNQDKIKDAADVQAGMHLKIPK